MKKTDPTNLVKCPGCKAAFPHMENPIALHPYGVMSPECWASFMNILAFESEHMGYPPEHRLIVDACAVQHPQNFELQKKLGIEKRLVTASIQSVGRHLIGLYCALEMHIPLLSISKIMGYVIEHGQPLELLEPPAELGKMTTADFSADFTPEQYKQFAWNWAHSSWKAWEPYHETVRGWVNKYALHGGK